MNPMNRSRVPLSGNNSRNGALDRALAILELLARSGPAPVTEISRRLGVSRSATYRIIRTLQERGYIEPANEPGMVRLGARAAQIGLAAVEGLDLTALAPAFLRRLVEETGETAFLGVVDGSDVVYLHKEASPHPVQMSAQLGSRKPLYCTGLGKAYLSALPDEERARIVGTLELVARTARTITDRDLLLEELALSHRRGYAIDNIEVEDGVGCFAAPVLDHGGQPVGAISIAGPSERVLPNESRFAPAVVTTAAQISARLGHRESRMEAV